MRVYIVKLCQIIQLIGTTCTQSSSKAYVDACRCCLFAADDDIDIEKGNPTAFIE